MAINFSNYLYNIYPFDPIGSKSAIIDSKLRKWSKTFDQEVQAALDTGRNLSPLTSENFEENGKPLTPDNFEENGKPSSPLVFYETRSEENHGYAKLFADAILTRLPNFSNYFQKMSGNILTPEPENLEDDHLFALEEGLYNKKQKNNNRRSKRRSKK